MTATERVEREISISSPSGLPRKPIGAVLVCVGWPSDEATGPVQSLLELARALSEEFHFRVIAREAKFTLRAAEKAAPAGWQRYGSVERYCCSMAWWGARGFAQLLRSTPYDILMLNGFFDPEFTIPALMLRRFGMVPRRPTILAPRGEFSKGALGLKSMRKQTYLKVVRALGLIDGVWLHATGEQEAEEIRAACPWAPRIAIAPNIRVLRPLPARGHSDPGGPLRLVFLSRIDRKKNLDYALHVLAGVQVPAVLDIYGPINDGAYWAECERIIAGLPDRVGARYQGVIANKAVCATLAGYDLFLLPTRGENFGHAIFDALEAGLPVLISDRTPWHDLAGAGYALPLAEPAAFATAIEQFARLGRAERALMRSAARSAAETAVKGSKAIARSRSMLLDALQTPRIAAAV
jgi:glycosyltransferase involved in cell wall biosynthesis